MTSKTEHHETRSDIPCFISAQSKRSVGVSRAPKANKITDVHNAYRKPQKQKAAISINTTNCIIIARKESTIKLFLSVTKARLWEAGG